MCRLQRKFRKKRNRNWTIKKELSDILSEIEEHPTFTNTKEVQPGNRNPADVGAVYGHDRGSIRNAGIFRTAEPNSQMGRSDRRITSDKEHI